jgi:hypothetical protein
MPRSIAVITEGVKPVVVVVVPREPTALTDRAGLLGGVLVAIVRGGARVSDGETIRAAPVIGAVGALHFPDGAAGVTLELAVLDLLPGCARRLEERIGRDRVRVALPAVSLIDALPAHDRVPGGLLCHDRGSSSSCVSWAASLRSSPGVEYLYFVCPGCRRSCRISSWLSR